MVVIERLFINARTHRLEALSSRPKGGVRGTFVLCHPFPLYGGNMYHKVLVKTTETLLEEGYGVIRFNMRGTGKSTGENPDDFGARTDLEAVLGRVSEEKSTGALWLGGYSYGAYVALSALVERVPGSFPGRFPVEGVMALAYPASMPEYRLNTLPDHTVGFIHGTEDELIPMATMKSFLSSQIPARKIYWVEGANHNFDGRMGELQEAVRSCLAEAGARA